MAYFTKGDINTIKETMTGGRYDDFIASLPPYGQVRFDKHTSVAMLGRLSKCNCGECKPLREKVQAAVDEGEYT